MDNNWSNNLNKLYVNILKNIKQKKISFDNSGHPIKLQMRSNLITELENSILQYAPSILYKYKPGTENDLAALGTNMIWFSCINEFNDPFECKIHINYESLAYDFLQKDEYLNALMIEKNMHRNDTQMINYMNSMKLIIQKLNDELIYKRNRLFVTCFSETKNSLLMWAHYANSHRGFCIEYNFQELSNIFGTMNLYPITYSNLYPTINTYDEYINHYTILINFPRTKSTDWSYEKEWRLLGEYKLNEPYQVGLLKPAPTPRAIYMGANINKDLKKRLTELCKMKNINLFQMIFSEKGYRLIAYKIKI